MEFLVAALANDRPIPRSNGYQIAVPLAESVVDLIEDGGQFAAAPTTSNPDRVTLLEEEKITAYYGGGTLYATPQRVEPLL